MRIATLASIVRLSPLASPPSSSNEHGFFILLCALNAPLALLIACLELCPFAPNRVSAFAILHFFFFFISLFVVISSRGTCALHGRFACFVAAFAFRGQMRAPRRHLGSAAFFLWMPAWYTAPMSALSCPEELRIELALAYAKDGVKKRALFLSRARVFFESAARSTAYASYIRFPAGTQNEPCIPNGCGSPRKTCCGRRSSRNFLTTCADRGQRAFN